MLLRYYSTVNSAACDIPDIPIPLGFSEKRQELRHQNLPEGDQNSEIGNAVLTIFSWGYA